MTETRKHVRVRRSAATPASPGNLVTIGTPTAITLCKVPANERPYQVVRSDDSGEVQRTPSGRVKRTIRRNDSPVLALVFPVGYSEDDVTNALLTFDMGGYAVTCDANGTYTACRSDLQSLADIETTDIKLNADGVIARLDASQYKITRSQPSDNLAMVALEFDAKRFDVDAVSAWMAENNVDSAQETVENPDSNSLTVKRSDIAEGTDVRRVQLDEGVVAVIARADTADLPEGFALAVNEAMYGNWGWGQLDFNAAMADVEFCRVMDDASYKLASVLRQITLNSQLPLEQRKALVDRSLTQYGDFVKNVIDALPRQVMLLVTRAAEIKEKEPMATTEQNQATTQRSDAGATTATTAPAAAPAAQAAGDAITMSRADLEALIDARVSAATTQRSEADPAAAAPAAAPAVAEAAPAAVGITRADLEAVVTTLTQKIENTVVVRSDSGDSVVKTKEAKTVKRGDTAVFGGMFNHLRGAGV